MTLPVVERSILLNRDSVNIYKHKNYRKFVRDMVDERKRFDPSISLSSLAEKIGIQRSYLSHVLNGKGNFSSDQLYQLGRNLNLDGEELDFLLLMLEIERCEVPERKRKLIAIRNDTSNNKLKSDTVLDRQPLKISQENLAKYYGEPLCSVVHMYLTIDKYLQDPKLISKQMRIAPKEFGQVLGTLEDCGVVSRSASGYTLNTPLMHMSQDSYFSTLHATMFRMKAIEYCQKKDTSKDYFFTATFSANEEVKTEIKVEYLAFLESISKKIEQAPSEEVFHMNFDLFKV